VRYFLAGIVAMTNMHIGDYRSMLGTICLFLMCIGFDLKTIIDRMGK